MIQPMVAKKTDHQQQDQYHLKYSTQYFYEIPLYM